MTVKAKGPMVRDWLVQRTWGHRMRRREFLIPAASTAAIRPTSTETQATALPIVGYLQNGTGQRRR
jgi:hypothetical protein